MGDNQWHLFDIVADPGETKDLKEEMPARFAAMMASYGRYVADNNVLPVPENYTQEQALLKYAIRGQTKGHMPIYATGRSPWPFPPF